ncbi:MAG TPA: Hsp20/alpha crystallin family protein [Candidatus Syntrophoarchaeum butanivorans]|uniref:Hsp20/alpha crystallin family protein n=1 Tax=Candidatus Syntropharchaeum butanivorans TaxID=1839936 RepID=A0A7C1B2W0_9EURY|nr:Hsp20/alpha crystallin family protein [Candidatus Syntrophoarchaeum butanivorans]
MVFHRRWIWDPFEELRRMQEWMDRVFGELYEETRLLPAPGEEVERTAVPSVDLIDKDDKLLLKADMPGISKDGIKVEIKGDRIEISAEAKKEEEEKEEGYIRRERRYTRYYRSIPLPEKVDPEKVEASFKDGVLSIEMPKVEAKEVKRIEVK